MQEHTDDGDRASTRECRELVEAEYVKRLDDACDAMQRGDVEAAERAYSEVGVLREIDRRIGGPGDHALAQIDRMRPGERRRWARGTLCKVLDRWDDLDHAGIVGSIRACLGALDPERVAADERVLDVASEVRASPVGGAEREDDLAARFARAVDESERLRAVRERRADG